MTAIGGRPARVLRSLLRPVRKEGSYFETCERDEDGRCLPKGQSGSQKPSDSGKTGSGGKDDSKTGSGGKSDDKKKPAAPEGEKLTKAPCCLYAPGPNRLLPQGDKPATHARVGVPAKYTPPPPPVGRLPNLTEKERAAETRFVEAFEADPEAFVADYRKRQNHVIGKDDKGNPIYEVGDAPNIFNTDDAKALSPDYNPQGVSKEEWLAAKGVYNAAVHQTANAIAKRAFVHRLDELLDLPPEKRTVLVTSGGVAAGKGYALQNAGGEVKKVMDEAGAIWDAAGEQNATENQWVLEECRKRGIKPVFAFVHADPTDTWENPKRGVVQRANVKGRMVDARLFADSYALGARNFDAFYKANKDGGDCSFVILDNSKGATPEVVQEMPEAALKIDGERLYAQAVKVLEERRQHLLPSVYRGGSLGLRVWGEPQAAAKRQRFAVRKSGPRSFLRRVV